jgi:hypothetical protein
MSVESLQLAGHLAGSSMRVPPCLYPDTWPNAGVRAAQRGRQFWMWRLSAWRKQSRLVLGGAGIPSAKGPVEVAESWTWIEPVAVFPGGSASRLLQALGLDPIPAPSLFLADSGVLVGMGALDGRPSVVHACSDVSRLQRYADRTEAARSTFIRAGLAELVPRIDRLIQRKEHACLYQQRLQGRVAGAQGLDVGALRARVRAALRPLGAIHRLGRPLPSGVDADWIDRLCSDLGAIPEWARSLKGPLAALPALAVRHQAPAVFVHGDYWLANLLFEPERESVCGIIDWERARPQGLAGFDALHLIAHAFASWRGCSPMRVPAMMWLDQCEPALDQLLCDAAETVQLDRTQLAEVALAFWLGNLHQHRNDRTRWRAERVDSWLRQPAAAAARWLAARTGSDR